jgi:hypothetical protein
MLDTLLPNSTLSIASASSTSNWEAIDKACISNSR